jgi:hypothetical protein
MSVLKSLFHNKPRSGETVLKNRTVLALIIAAVFCGLLSFLGSSQGHASQGHTSATQIKTQTVPSGYFELTVSPAEVYANVGEQIEIRCSINCLIDTVVEVSSVDVLLFDSYGSMIREQAMTKDSYWSAYTVYTIVGDEAYYQIKFNFCHVNIPSYDKFHCATDYTVDSFPFVVHGTDLLTRSTYSRACARLMQKTLPAPT